MASTTNRISGLASGMDTESMVKSLMKVEKMPIDKVKQKKQVVEWRVAEYRDITSTLRSFKDEYMNLLKQDNNMSSKSTYNSFSSTIADKITGVASSAVTVITNSETLEANHTVKIDMLATSATTTSTTGVTKGIESNDQIVIFNLADKKMKVSLDGIEKTITLDDYADVAAMATDIQNKITTAFGKGIDGVNGKVTVNETALNSGKLEFNTANGANVLSLSGSGDPLTDGLTHLNVASGTKNRLSTAAKLSDIVDKLNVPLTFGGTDNDEIKFKINNKEFTFKSTATLKDMMIQVNNNQDANVTMKYDEVTDKFTIQAKQLGSGDNITISQTEGDFFGAVSNIAVGSYANGVDSKVTIDGEEIIRNSNSFAVNNVTYNLKATTTNALDVKLNIDADKVYDKIKTFIDKYNELLDKLNNKTNEEYDRAYTPLTDDQRETMSEDDITKWETKAKTGLLKNDSLITKIVGDMRTALTETISGVSQGFFNIGITTTDFREKGKLHIDENKLKEAIRSQPDVVANIFAKQSESQPAYSRTATNDQRRLRHQEEGLINRISDIIDDNISAYRDSSNHKGMLLERAGMLGDVSVVNNTLYKEISGYTALIGSLEAKLSKKEDNYYKKFAAMETAMQKANQQGSWIASQMGGNSN